MEKEKRNCKADTRLTNSEFKMVKNAAAKLEMSLSEYIRKQIVPEDGVNSIVNIMNKAYVAVKKEDVGMWYVDMVNTINAVDNGEIKKQLFCRLEEWECLLSK